MSKKRLSSLGLIVLSFFLGVYFYYQIPGREVAVHFGLDGQVNGYMSKGWGIFILPLIMAVFYLFYLLIPNIDPLKSNIEKFRRHYEGFGLVMVIFLFYLFLLMMVWNKGARFDMTRLLVPAFSFLIYYMGIVMSHTKRNWLFGVRTPWTLSSDKVWDETHRVASSLYKVSAIVSLLGLFGGNVIIFFLVPVLASSVFVVGYSYWFFTKTK